jgi:Icc protein
MRGTTIAHISDLHLNAQFKQVNVLRARILLQNIARLEADHVVVTGDITSGALPEDFAQARELFAEAGLLHPSRLSLIAGNHDIYGGVHTAEDVLTFPGRCRMTAYELKVREFAQRFPEAFERTLTASKESPFPFVKMINDIVLIGLNSVARYSGVRNPLGSNGWVDDQQVDRFERLAGLPLFAGKRKIVLIHHHFCKLERNGLGTMHTVWGTIERQTMKLRGKKDLLRLFRKHGVELVLHGHYHRTMEYTRKGITFVNAGGSVLDALDDTLHVNLLHVGPQRITVSRHRVPLEVGEDSPRPRHTIPAVLEQAA